MPLLRTRPSHAPPRAISRLVGLTRYPTRLVYAYLQVSTGITGIYRYLPVSTGIYVVLVNVVESKFLLRLLPDLVS